MPLQFLQLCIFRQLWWHPTGASSDFFSENNWDAASLVQGAAPFIVHVTNKRRRSSGQSPHDLGRPFQDSEANLVSIGVSIWRRLAIMWYTLVQNLSPCRRSMSGGLFIWTRQGHMPIHPLKKAWPFGDWRMPAASTGASTSSGAADCWVLRVLTTWYGTTRYL